MTKKMYLLDRQTREMTAVPEKQYIELGRAREEIPISKEEKYKPRTIGISRIHCRLIRQDLSDVMIEDTNASMVIFPSGLGVMDLKSKNGTYINGNRTLSEPLPLNSGDILSLETYEFQVIIDNLKPLTEPITASATVTIP